MLNTIIWKKMNTFQSYTTVQSYTVLRYTVSISKFNANTNFCYTSYVSCDMIIPVNTDVKSFVYKYVDIFHCFHAPVFF